MNTTSLRSLPELQSLSTADRLVRIPPEANVPLSARIGRLLDTTAMRRLGHVSQLGLVSLVYPGATHSRLEHSLGVYRNALLFLEQLAAGERFSEIIDVRGAERLLVAALLHDIGHWPFCHPIEDMRLADIPEHEDLARGLLENPEISKLLAADWNLTPEDIATLLSGELQTDQDRVLGSLLSGPIDVDKMDYLQRDSLHAGVPYGRNFDAARLIASLTIHPEQPRLAITEKGRTAAEMMVFSRYVMFSEVYWHHTVRAATAMLQRAVYLLKDRIAWPDVFRMQDAAYIDHLKQISRDTPAAAIVDGLFGASRRLYKRAGQFSVLDSQEIHGSLAGRSYDELVSRSTTLAEQLARETGQPISAADILIDAPPAKLEVDINVNVVDTSGAVRTLGDVSPVAAVLSRQQFDNYVKRVRIFVAPHLCSRINADRVKDLLGP